MVTASIIIPCYNEGSTLSACVERVMAIADENLGLEIIIVDDGSDDGSRAIAESLSQAHKNITTLVHEKNRGKGAALRTGIQKATEDIVAVQDADLEYNPQDLKKMISLIGSDKADVVIGSRFLTGGQHRVLYFWHSLGNRVLTFLSNMLTDMNLTDMESCYKVFKRDIIKDIEIRENRFGFEPEIIAKIAEKRPRIYEIGISYYGRTYEEGKKINAKDGIRALYCIIRYNACRAPIPLQFLCYIPLVLAASLVGLAVFSISAHLTNGFYATTAPAFIVFVLLQTFGAMLLIFNGRENWSRLLKMVTHTVNSVITLVLGLTLTATLNGGLPSDLKTLMAGFFLSALWYYVSNRFIISPRSPLSPEHVD